MASFGKVLGVAALAFGAMIGAKWYHTAAIEEIDPQRGVYGMNGMEIWIDINARGMDTERAAAVRACFDAKMTAAVTPEDIAALNESAVGEAASKVVLAVNEAARVCKAEVGG